MMTSAISTAVLGMFYFAVAQSQLTCQRGVNVDQQVFLATQSIACNTGELCGRIEFTLTSKYNLWSINKLKNLFVNFLQGAVTLLKTNRSQRCRKLILQNKRLKNFFLIDSIEIVDLL